ncbi:hypothetical protein CFC21_009902 [Triticum aestivum]|uniref:DUF6598 domain-containing protein n=2 Tax=Triticum aestivum TaxID=4565 RepID=A0A3B5ZPH8_WHEAT|nr:hypothetical protein CFC21_009902 [Triticum aestivum]
MAHVEEEEVVDMEPLFFSEAYVAKMVADAEEEEERCRREEEDKMRKEKEYRRRREAHEAVMDSIIQHDPKVERDVYTRFFLRDFSVFDIDEESSVPPMRYTDSIYEDEFGLEDSANILSVSIVSSDVGFPVNVYGCVIARDSIDYKCIYLFHRNRDDCQRLNEDGMLILTGPGRGLVLVDFIYLEIDLKIREDGVFPDRPFSKGLISIDGRVLSREEDVVVRRETLESWLSTTEVRFATVLKAVECTIEIELLEGRFKGNIIAGISDKDRNLATEQTIVIHDSRTDGMVTSDRSGVIKLRRSVITICLERMMVFQMNNKAGGGCDQRTVDLTPRRTGAPHRTVDFSVITCGAVKFGFRVVWSLMDFRL